MKLKEAVKKAEESIEVDACLLRLPSEHWARIHIQQCN